MARGGVKLKDWQGHDPHPHVFQKKNEKRKGGFPPLAKKKKHH